LLIVLGAVACSSTTENEADTNTFLDVPCTVLFGKPAENTGVDADMCKPWCACKDRVFHPPEYTARDVEFLRSLRLTNPPKELTEDPYEHPEQYPGHPEQVCGVLLNGDGSYTLKTFDGVGQASAAGARVTHYGACGLCSSLEDLAVYMEKTDLSGPVRDCAIKAIAHGMDEAVKCLMDIGFTHACAQIWYYDSKHTRENCKICFKMLNDPYQHPDGTLNDCIQCDEDESGPVFKAVAGRTRRDSGLPSALCRPCADVAPVIHDYR
jgi:hypothetical protein